MKTLFKVAFVSGLFAIALSLPGTARAITDIYVGTTIADSGADIGTSDNPYPTIGDAMAVAVDGDSIIIDGTIVTTSSVTVNKEITIKGVNSGKIETSGGGNVFTITAPNVIISDLQFVKTDKTGTVNLVQVQAANVTISNNIFIGDYVLGDPETVRALEISGTAAGFTVSGNTISGVRQPAYINNAVGTVSNNEVSGTRGWVVVSDAGATFTDNTFSGNAVDIAIVCPTLVADSATCPAANNYADIVSLSVANNNAAVENQTPVKNNAVLATVYVDSSVTSTGNGLKDSPYKTIAEALPRVGAGGTINVAAGAYNENVTISKAVTVAGPNAGVAGTGSRAAEAVITGQVAIYSSDVSFKGFTITNPSWSGASVKGVHVYSAGTVLSNVNVSNNIMTSVNNANTSGAYGIMVQGVVDGVTVDGNKIDSIVSKGWARGIEVTPTGGSAIVPKNVTITNNSITGVSSATGDEYDFSADWSSSNSVVADASQITFKRNSMDGFKIKNLDTANALNATENWWGSAAPDFATTTATGTISTKPWYIDAGLTTLYADPVAPGPATPTFPDGVGVRTGGGGAPVGFFPTVISAPAPTTGSIGQVLGIETFNFAQNLRYGMRNNDVLELQKRLAAEGFFKVNPTGYFGPITLFSLKLYQATNQINPVSGFVGPLTRAALNR